MSVNVVSKNYLHNYSWCVMQVHILRLYLHND